MSIDFLHPLNNPLEGPLRCQRGNVAVTMAFALVLLVGVMVFTLDSAHLYTTRNRFQNAVEAAALAGAADLCGADPEATVRSIAAENKIPFDGSSLHMETGFYDIYDQYADFNGYPDFAADTDGDFPEDEYVNAVLVRLTVSRAPLAGGLPDGGDIRVAAAAVAFRQGYGLLASGNAAQNAINIGENWPDGYLRLDLLGRIHSSGDIRCQTPPVVGEATFTTAAGAITHMPGGTDGWRQSVHIRPIDWEQLRGRAEENGRVIHFSDFPPRGSISPLGRDDYVTDAAGNRYYSMNTVSTCSFALHAGDHGGAVYYFSGEGAPESATININACSNGNALNLIVASELIIAQNTVGFSYSNGGLGGKNRDAVWIYCRENIGLFNSNFNKIPHLGVVYRTEKDFLGRFPQPERTHYMRIIAGGNITLTGHRYLMAETGRTTVNGSFAPPCGPALVKLGRL